MTSIRWMKHLSEDKEKESFQRKLNNSKQVFKVLHALIKEDYAVSERIIHDRTAFEYASWSEKTAFELGVQKALDDILKLTKVD